MQQFILLGWKTSLWPRLSCSEVVLCPHWLHILGIQFFCLLICTCQDRLIVLHPQVSLGLPLVWGHGLPRQSRPWYRPNRQKHPRGCRGHAQPNVWKVWSWRGPLLNAFTRSTLLKVFEPFNLCVKWRRLGRGNESRTVLLLRSRKSPHSLRPPEDLGCKWRALWPPFLTLEVVALFWRWRLLLGVNDMFDAKFGVNLKSGSKISGYSLRNFTLVLFLVYFFFFRATCQWLGHSVKKICHF